MKGGGHMKTIMAFLVSAFVLLTFIGVGVAEEMSGEVIAVDTMKSTLTLKSGTVEAGFDCEEGSLIKNVKVGDHVTVEYKVENGRKIAKEVTPEKRKPAGRY
jgi:hypothetical protein